MPMSKSLRERLFPILPEIIKRFGTPFIIHDEKGIIETGKAFKSAFRNVYGFKEFFAVKASPVPAILKIMRQLGFGVDCSSIPELVMARSLGFSGEEIMYSSNDTSLKEFEAALDHGGCILNLDDITMVKKVPRFPKLICFRYNPGERRSGNKIIGNPKEAKYGVTIDQITDAYQQAILRGAEHIGLHSMIISNNLDYVFVAETVSMSLDVVEMVSEDLLIEFEFINIGGGIGVPQKPGDKPFDLSALARETEKLLERFKKRHGYVPKLFTECGRGIVGSHGAFVTTVINRMSKYREYIGVDGSMADFMRPGMYGEEYGYHSITVLDCSGCPKGEPKEVVDVSGPLCENCDKFAIQRLLPIAVEGDLIVLEDAGAHGRAMGFNYNGRLRCKELLLRENGQVELIRRAETIEDYFATLQFKPNIWGPK